MVIRREEQASSVALLTMLHQMSEMARGTHDVPAVCEAALNYLQQSLEAASAAVLSRDEAGTIQFACWQGFSEGFRKQLAAYDGWAMLLAEPQFFDDVRKAPSLEALRPVLERESLRAFAVIPVAAWGAVLLADREPRAFEEWERLFAQEMAARLAAALARTPGEGESGRSPDELEAILDHVTEGIVVQGADGQLVYANAAAAAQAGFDTVEAMLATPISQLLSRFELFTEQGERFPLEELPGRKAFRGETPENTLVRFRHNASGEERWALMNARAVRDEQGQIREVVHIFRDVTRYREMFEAEQLARAQAQDAQHRLEFLAQASEILSQSLDYETTLQRIAGLAVPGLADLCGVDLAKPDGSIERVAVSHIDPEKAEFVVEFSRRFPARPGAPRGIGYVIRTGQPDIFPLITDEMLVQGAYNEEHLGLLRQLELHAVIIVPLHGRERVLGALYLASTVSKRDFDEEDVAFATEVARRAALAVENARLYREVTRSNEVLEQRVAQRTVELQEKILAHRRAERQFRSLLESAPDPIIIVGEDDEMVLVNSQAERMFGYASEEMLGQRVQMLISAGLSAFYGSFGEEQGARLSEQRPLGLDLTARRKDGSEFQVEVSLSPLETEQGILHTALVRDVTERREAEQRLQKSQMQLAQAQRIAHLGSWEWDVASDTVTWSEEMFRIYGLTREVFGGTYEAFLEQVNPEERAEIDRLLRHAVQTREPFSYDERVVRPDGTVRLLHSHGEVVVGEDGSALRVIGTCQDVTELKQAEQALRQSEALYRSIAQNIPNGLVALVDKTLRVRLVEGTLLRTGPLYNLEMEGKTIAEFLPPDLANRRKGQYEAAFAGETVTDEFVIDGHTLLTQIVPLTDEQGEVYAALALVQDITERKEAEETTRSLLRLSEKLNATLDLDTLLDTLIEEAIALTRAESGICGLNTREGLVTNKYYHKGEAVPIDEIWPPGRGVPGWLLENKRPYLSNDADGDNLVVPAFCERFGIKTILSTPVLDADGEVLAFFEVNNRVDGSGFTINDVKKLVAVSQIASIAIQNAKLYESMRILSRKVVHAQEEERRRLSLELHDSAGQLLTALQINLAMLGAQIPRESPVGAMLQEATELANVAHEEIRAASHALRPPALEVVGLNSTLHSLCRDFAKQTELEIEYEGVEVSGIPDQVSISFYRFLQEVLANVVKHARATLVQVKLEQDGEELKIMVKDNGVGMDENDLNFTASNVRAGMGLLGLRERFDLIGGHVEGTSTPDEGTCIIARAPIT